MIAPNALQRSPLRKIQPIARGDGGDEASMASVLSFVVAGTIISPLSYHR